MNVKHLIRSLEILKDQNLIDDDTIVMIEYDGPETTTTKKLGMITVNDIYSVTLEGE